MLVRIRPGPELSGAEREFVECLRAYPSTGLALVDCRVGDRRLGAVIMTPRGITVIEVKGFRRRQSGLLAVSAGAWTISDNPLELDTEQSAGLTDQVEHGVHAVRVALEQALQDGGHIAGAVVLVPYRGVVVRPARTALRPGLDVLIANTIDAHELRVYLEGFAAGRREWTVDRVRNACTALGVAQLTPSKAELADDGFDTNRPAQAPIPPPPRKFTAPVAAPPPVAPSRRDRLVGPIVFAAALLGVFVVFLVVGHALLQDSPGQRSTTTTTTTTTSVAVPGTQPRPECFPFEPTC
ncbi:NERD domain-containing protein [Nocardia rhizosphaerae]|uniref:NERD domain-containing protein n=1 Tax=Nocardia rhizosphaerae TaxID=1691571 RepID=A0ABV8L5E3_9NOCA